MMSPKIFVGELGWCVMEYTGSPDKKVFIGNKTNARYETWRAVLLVDLRDRNSLLASGHFKLKEGKT